MTTILYNVYLYILYVVHVLSHPNCRVHLAFLTS